MQTMRDTDNIGNRSGGTSMWFMKMEGVYVRGFEKRKGEGGVRTCLWKGEGYGGGTLTGGLGSARSNTGA